MDKPLVHPPYRRYFLYPAVQVFSAILFTICGTYRVRGAYRLPKKGGVLLLSNHLADCDALFVQLATRRPIHFMAKSELYDMPMVGTLLRAFGAFAVKRGEPDRAALKHAAALLKNEQVVGIFPEGQLSETGDLQEIKPGVALIVRMSEVPVICLGIRGTQRVMPYGRIWPKLAFRKCHAVWGEPRTFDKSSTTEEIVDWIRGQLLMLSSEE